MLPEGEKLYATKTDRKVLQLRGHNLIFQTSSQAFEGTPSMSEIIIYEDPESPSLFR